MTTLLNEIQVNKKFIRVVKSLPISVVFVKRRLEFKTTFKKKNQLKKIHGEHSTLFVVEFFFNYKKNNCKRPNYLEILMIYGTDLLNLFRFFTEKFIILNGTMESNFREKKRKS